MCLELPKYLPPLLFIACISHFFHLTLLSFQEHPWEFPLVKNYVGFSLKSYLHFTFILDFLLWLLYHYNVYMWVCFCFLTFWKMDISFVSQNSQLLFHHILTLSIISLLSWHSNWIHLSVYPLWFLMGFTNYSSIWFYIWNLYIFFCSIFQFIYSLQSAGFEIIELHVKKLYLIPFSNFLGHLTFSFPCRYFQSCLLI